MAPLSRRWSPCLIPQGYAHLFHMNPSGMAFGVALEDSLIHKSTFPQPLVRLSFHDAAGDICLLDVAEVTNADRHNVAASATGCVTPGTFCLGDVNDNGIRDVGDLL